MKFFKFLVPNRKSIILGAIYLGFNLSVGMLFTAYIVSLVGLAEESLTRAQAYLPPPQLVSATP